MSSLRFMRPNTRFREKTVAECLKQGVPVFERVRFPGYSTYQERCTRCKIQKHRHVITA